MGLYVGIDCLDVIILVKVLCGVYILLEFGLIMWKKNFRKIYFFGFSLVQKFDRNKDFYGNMVLK